MELITSSPLFGITLTILAYIGGVLLYQKTKIIFLSPLITAVSSIILVLNVFSIPVELYNEGASIITMLLAPATAALAYSIYQQIKILKQHLIPILAGTLMGAFTSIFTVIVLAKLTGLNDQMLVSLLPKSATTAIAIEISRSNGGVIGVTIAAVLVTGVLGAMLAPILIKLFGIKNRVAAGIAIGSSSHGLGTAKAIEIGELEGAMSGLAMGISGFFTVILSLFVLL